MDALNFIWNQVIIDSMINALLWLYDFLGNNFFLAIAVFTVVLRVATLPTQMRQQRSSIKMQALQPQIQAIQKKYRDNPQKMNEEFRKIGYNPTETLTGCLPLLLQMPILIGLYRAILIILGSTPQSLLELSQRVWGGIDLASLLPITNKVGWLNLAQPDPILVLPALVLISSYFSQRVLMPSSKKKDDKKGKGKQDDNPMAGVTQSMQYTMPIMFGVMSLQFPAGLSIYWILTSLIGAVLGVYVRRQMPADPSELGIKVRESDEEEEEESAPRRPTKDHTKPTGRSSGRRKSRSAKR
jgi:YidC/Oxa1 family membrane protein insertase